MNCNEPLNSTVPPEKIFIKAEVDSDGSNSFRCAKTKNYSNLDCDVQTLQSNSIHVKEEPNELTFEYENKGIFVHVKDQEVQSDSEIDENGFKSDSEETEKQVHLPERSNRLKPNRESMLEKRQHFCDVCSFKTPLRATMKKHVLTHGEDRLFSCEFCSYKTNHKFVLKTHNLSHMGQKPFSCELCSYRTNDKSNLRKHTVIHARENPFSCEQCNYKTHTEIMLKKHISTHGGKAKPFACSICSYKTAKNAHLKIHHLTHSNEKHIQCLLCSYKTNKNSSLRMHMLTHGGKPFSCALCSYKTRQKPSLERHIMAHTRETTSMN